MRFSLKTALVVVGLLCIAAVLVREFVFVDRFEIGTNHNIVSFAEDIYLERALKLDFSFESEGGFGTVHVKGVKYRKHSLVNSRSDDADAQDFDVDFWIEVSGKRSWVSTNPIDNPELVQRKLLLQIEREIDQRLGGKSGAKFEDANIVRVSP